VLLYVGRPCVVVIRSFARDVRDGYRRSARVLVLESQGLPPTSWVSAIAYDADTVKASPNPTIRRRWSLNSNP